MAAAPYPAYHGASPMPENGIKKEPRRWGGGPFL